jgi:N4-gp56 family major capsid protein
MALQKYSTVLSRNLLRAEPEMLAHAETIIVLGKFGLQKSQPLKKTDTVVFRKVQPFNAGSNGVAQITPANFVTSEGVTPTANTISYVDITATLQQFAVLFKFSSKAELMYEDDIPGDMKKLTGDTMGEIAELVCYGQLRGGTTVIRANGTTRVGINTPISINKLRLAARTIAMNRGKKVTKAIAAGPNFDTHAVQPGYPVFMHSDCSADVQNLPNYTPKVKYGGAIQPLHDNEIGECEGFRFIVSPLFTPWLAAGAAVGSSGMYAANATNIDIYPMLVMAEDAWGHISLKGNEYTGITPVLIPCSQINHANPSGMYGFVGANFWYTPVRLNENWMVRIEVAVTDLS